MLYYAGALPSPGSKYYIILDSKQAYGSRGYSTLIKAEESVFFNIEVIDLKLI